MSLSQFGLAILLTAFTIAGATPAAASSEGLLGLWLTQDGDAHIRIERCDDGLCGRIVWMRDPLNKAGEAWRDVENPDESLRDRPVQGMTILRIADASDGQEVLRGGRIYDPKSGRTYSCTLRPDGSDALKMRGFMGISLLGRTSRWTRVSGDADSKQGSLATGQ